jgi:SAM-dependent methyltransferase
MFSLPPVFDPFSYRERYPDLAGLRRSQLREHWLNGGRREGRNAAPMESWAELLHFLQPARSILEIGPFDNPSIEFLRHHGVIVDYADYFSSEGLVERAAKTAGRNPDSVPCIRYVLSDGGYEQISEKYDAVVSRHCVEHQPDLISHFLSVLPLLEPHGIYLFSMPNRLRCFDRHLPPTHLVHVLAAYLEKRFRPPLEAVLEHRCFTVPDWRNDADPADELPLNLRERLDMACREFEEHAYVDVHCWKFTEDSLRRIMHKLVQLCYLPFSTKIRTYNLGNEFAVAMAFSPKAHSAF